MQCSDLTECCMLNICSQSGRNPGLVNAFSPKSFCGTHEHFLRSNICILITSRETTA